MTLAAVLAGLAYLAVGLACAQRLLPWDQAPFFFRGPGRLAASNPDARSLNRLAATATLCALVAVLWPVYFCASRRRSRQLDEASRRIKGPSAPISGSGSRPEC